MKCVRFDLFPSPLSAANGCLPIDYIFICTLMRCFKIMKTQTEGERYVNICQHWRSFGQRHFFGALNLLLLCMNDKILGSLCPSQSIYSRLHRSMCSLCFFVVFT